MALHREDVDTTVYIPANYSDSGKFFGLIGFRNLVDVALFALIPGFILYSVLPQELSTLMIILLTCGPVAAICIIGIFGDPVSVFIKNMFVFLKKRRKLKFRFKRI